MDPLDESPTTPLPGTPPSPGTERSPTLVEFPAPSFGSSKPGSHDGGKNAATPDRVVVKQQQFNVDISKADQKAIATTLAAALEETMRNGDISSDNVKKSSSWWTRLLPKKLRDAGWLIIPNQEYCEEWCQHAGMIMFSVISTWMVTKMGGGLPGCLIVGGILVTCYRRSLRRLKRNAKSDLEHAMIEQRMLTDFSETADWLNHFVQRFWLIYEPILSAQIIGIADAILIESTPSFLDSIRLSQFTLGNRPFRIDSIKTYPRTEPNVVCMDWDISFTPTNVLDMTQRDLKAHVRPKIVLTIRVGKGLLGAGMPVLLEDLSFKGKLRLTLTLSKKFPHIKTVEASFLEKPHFDYALKPVGGETFGFDINNIPGLQTFVQEQVHATLGPMMYAPNVYKLDVAGMMAGTTDIHSANGVLVMTIYNATNLKEVDLFGTIDPYITFHVGNTRNAELARTSMYHDTSNPRWNETHFILLNNLDDTLYLQVMDYNSGFRDSQIGVAEFDLTEVENAARKAVQGLQLTVLRGGRPVGQVACDMRYFSVSRPVHDADGAVTMPAADSNSGVLQLTVNECSGLAGDYVNASTIVRVNGRERMRTAVFKRSSHPRWNKSVEIFVADRTKMELSVTVVDNKEFADDEVIGRWRMMLEDLLQQVPMGVGWWGLKDGPGHINLSATWKPIVMADMFATPAMPSGQQRNPIGVARLHIHAARELVNVEAVGKSDPYVRVLSGTQVRAQTEYRDDDLDPEWDTTLYVPVHSIYENLVLEVMDFNSITSDVSMGLYDLSLKRIVKEHAMADGQTYHEACGVFDEWVDLSSPDRTVENDMGQLHITASFIPVMQTRTINPTNDEDEQVVVVQPPKDLHGERIKYTTIQDEGDQQQVDLMAYESGVLCVTVNEVKLPEPIKAKVDLLLDSNDPQFTTTERKAGQLFFNETGDAFVKELDFSKLMVRVRPGRGEKVDGGLGYYNIAVREIVRRIMAGNGDQQAFDLIDGNGGSVTLSFKFIPVVHFKLDAKESLENQGNLTVTVLSASNLPAVDRSGTSDPFVVFYLDGQKVHKTEVYKKQLDPKFKDEVFTVPVPNRIDAKLTAEVYDWDQFGKDRMMCECEILFGANDLESFAARNLSFKMKDHPQSSLKARLLWQPQLLARKRTGSQLLFNATTRMFTSAPGAVFGVGKDVFGHSMSAIKRFSTNASSISTKIMEESEPLESLQGTAALQVTLVSARRLKAMDRSGTSDPYARVSLDDKVIHKTRSMKKTLHPEWNENLRTRIINDSSKPAMLEIKVRDWNTFTDVDIGECTFNVWDLIQNDALFYDGWLPLQPEGTGEIHIRVRLMQ